MPSPAWQQAGREWKVLPSRAWAASGREFVQVLPRQGATSLANERVHFVHTEENRRRVATSLRGHDALVDENQQLRHRQAPPRRRGEHTPDARVTRPPAGIGDALSRPPPAGPPTLAQATARLYRVSGDLGKEGAPRPDMIERLLAEGRVIVCEAKGPYEADNYHKNVTGTHRGYSSLSLWSAAAAKHDAALAKLNDWSELDPENLGDLDCGLGLGSG